MRKFNRQSNRVAKDWWKNSLSILFSSDKCTRILASSSFRPHLRQTTTQLQKQHGATCATLLIHSTFSKFACSLWRWPKTFSRAAHAFGYWRWDDFARRSAHSPTRPACGVGKVRLRAGRAPVAHRHSLSISHGPHCRPLTTCSNTTTNNREYNKLIHFFPISLLKFMKRTRIQK